MTEYFDRMCEAMSLLAEDPQVIFMGQAVGETGTVMSRTLEHIPKEKRLEFPVAEDMQLGMSLGMSLLGEIPICIYPRWNFLLLAANQLVNHLDKYPLMSDWNPKVIIRVAAAGEKPINPGWQHVGDFSQAFYRMLKTVKVTRIDEANQIVPAYQRALESTWSTILVEDHGR